MVSRIQKVFTYDREQTPQGSSQSWRALWPEERAQSRCWCHLKTPRAFLELEEGSRKAGGREESSKKRRGEGIREERRLQ